MYDIISFKIKGGFNTKKYKMYLDESGNFGNHNERYFILGGLIFNTENENIIDSVFSPLKRHLCYAYNISELHASKNKSLYSIIAPVIGSNCNVIPFAIIIDKKESWAFDVLYDKSFRYNKAIEYICKRLIEEQIISNHDCVDIVLDDININKKEKDNLKNYLPNNFKYINSVSEKKSEEDIYLQYADIIVNSFPRNAKLKLNTRRYKLLNARIFYFLPSTENEYID